MLGRLVPWVRIGVLALAGITLVSDGCAPPQGGDQRALCSDGARDGSETDIDCGGGTCGPCAAQSACRVPADCASSVCRAGLCQQPSCSDGARNGDETAVDCGGACAPCISGAPCAAARDCASGVCGGGVCQEPSCTDGVKNGAETDADCGGTCGRCPSGKGCRVAADCVSTVCQSGRCVAPSCTDGVKNGAESDLDCGGSCAPCADGKRCTAGPDCGSQVCTAATCQAATCADGVKNGAETDTDCGGARCGRCALGKACAAPTDCGSGNCAADRCDAANLVQDGVRRRWSDGGFAAACHEYISPPAGKSYSGAIGDGRYTIDPDGVGLGAAPFDVYCDMTTSGGGWTLVDNDADAAAAFTTREPGANPDPMVTRGSYLPAYAWSSKPQLLCKASVFTGAASWVTLNALGQLALEYPTKTTPRDATYAGQWGYDQLNGNNSQGTEAWIYVGSGRFGSVWIGNGGQPTCACDYYAPSPETGLGTYTSGNAPTCSTWVR